jgi:hypothetical protein
MFPPSKKPPQLPKASSDHVPGDSPQPFRSPVNQQRGISPHAAISAQQPRGVSPSYGSSSAPQQRGVSPLYTAASASPQLYAMSSPTNAPSGSLTPLSGPMSSPTPPPVMPPAYIAQQTYSSPYLYTPQYSGQKAVHQAPVHHASVISRSYPAAAAAATNPSSPPQATQPASVTQTPVHSKTTSLHLQAPPGDYTLQYSSPTPSPTPSERGATEYPATETPTTEYEDDEPDLPVDPTDMLARLCSKEKIKADDLAFWKRVMDGTEWAFYETHSDQVQTLLQQYCKSFVRNAAKSRNFHAMLLVICRHLENYSQTLHGLAGGGENASNPPNHLAVPQANAASQGGSSNVNASGAVPPSTLSKDHPWITQLLYFLRLMIQYILSHLTYDETLLFFQHLAIPDLASKPGTPKHPSTASASMYASEGNWSSDKPMPAENTLSPPQMKHHTINLNPNSRRSSVNSQVDILTRFVCAIVNQLEVFGDVGLNAIMASGKAVQTSGPARGSFSASSPTLSAASSPTHKTSQPLVDLHLELLNTFFVMLSTQMYLPLSTEYEQVFLDRLMYCCKPPMLNSIQGFMTSLVTNFTEVLPADWANTLARKQQAEKPKSFFSKITSSLTNLLYFPVWAVRYLFTIPPNHPLMDRSTLLIELLVYQNNDNDFRSAIRKLRNADKPRPPQMLTTSGAGATNNHATASSLSPPNPASLSMLEEDLSQNTVMQNLELGAVSFDKLYYALCSTLLSEHVNLFLYSLIHENTSFRMYLLRQHQHDLDYLLMPMLEILYREVDISKHHVYMIINIWILLTQQQGFDLIIKSIRIKEVPFFKEVVLKDLTLTQVMQIVLLRTLQLNLRTKLKEPHIFNNCIPEDHQLLTDQGFLFLHEVQAAVKSATPLRVACYDKSAAQLQYRAIQPEDLVVKDGAHQMVDIASKQQGVNSNHVDVSVTADHDLFVRFRSDDKRSATGFHKVPAGELVKQAEGTQFQMLSAATGGVETDALSREQLRSMVKGLQKASGSADGESDAIFTSSVASRDQLMITLLHAGYSAHFVRTEGTNDGWTVRYSDASHATEPVMAVDRDVTTRFYTGRVWCVNVPHDDHLIVVRRVTSLSTDGVVEEASQPVIIGNCLAAFCNLTITALLGPTGTTPASTPTNSPPPTPPTASAPQLPGMTSPPMTLHPQVAFRLTRVLCILSRKFLVLQVHHEQQITDHNARLEKLIQEGRDTEDGLTEEEEKEEVELEEVAEELGTCMEFIQLLLEVVNHSIVHTRPESSPLLPPSQLANLNASGVPVGFQSSLSTNAHLLYNLIHSQEYFLQLLPYEDLYEKHLIRNITNTLVFYQTASGVQIQTGEAGQRSTAGGKNFTGFGGGGKTDKEVTQAVAQLQKAIHATPLGSASPHSPKASHPSMPDFHSSALIERGPFTYHEQENSQDFFVPYIFQLLQTMNILPKMYAPGESAATVALTTANASGALGDVNGQWEKPLWGSVVVFAAVC